MFDWKGATWSVFLADRWEDDRGSPVHRFEGP